MSGVERSHLRIGLIRAAIALAAAQVVATLLAMLVGPEKIPAALLLTLALVPGIVATIVLETIGRDVLARVAYVLWVAALLVLLDLWVERSGDPSLRPVQGMLVPFWLGTGVAAWGILRRGWPLLRRLAA